MHCKPLDKDLFDILQALLTPVIAIIAVRIGYLQYKHSREKLRLDLYNKRFAVFSAARNFLSAIVREGVPSQATTSRFSIDSAEAQFLFASDIIDFLESLLKEGYRAQDLQRRLRGEMDLPDGRTRDEVVDELADVMKDFLPKFEQSRDLFGGYLRFKS